MGDNLLYRAFAGLGADKPFCGCKAHEAMDPDSRLITGLTVVAGNAHEGAQTDALLAAQIPALWEGTTIIGDGYYNNATTVEQVEAAGMRPGRLQGYPKRWRR